jgi:CheY-like chemotaxis protein
MSRVLLVDDDACIRDALSAVLHETGHTVTLAVDGAEGLRLANSANPEVIVSDVMMPVMDGPEMVRRMKATPRLANVPVILMSALETVPRVPVAAMLRKPLDPSMLLRLIHEITHDSASADPVTGDARAEIADEANDCRSVDIAAPVPLPAAALWDIESWSTTRIPLGF